MRVIGCHSGQPNNTETGANISQKSTSGRKRVPKERQATPQKRKGCATHVHVHTRLRTPLRAYISKYPCQAASDLLSMNGFGSPDECQFAELEDGQPLLESPATLRSDSFAGHGNVHLLPSTPSN